MFLYEFCDLLCQFAKLSLCWVMTGASDVNVRRQYAHIQLVYVTVTVWLLLKVWYVSSPVRTSILYRTDMFIVFINDHECKQWSTMMISCCYGRPLSVSGRPCYILPMFFLINFFYGRLILRPWLTEVRESFTRGGPWVSLEKLVLGFLSWSPLNYRVGQKVTKFGVFSDPTRKRSALTPERGRIL